MFYGGGVKFLNEFLGVLGVWFYLCAPFTKNC